MDKTTWNRIALALAALAALASLASLWTPLGASLTSHAAILGYVLLLGALATVRPDTREDEIPPEGSAHLLGVLAFLAAAAIGLLLAAALLAALGDVRYLGERAVFLAENFTIAASPLLFLLSVATLASAAGKLTVHERPDRARRIVGPSLGALIALLATAIAQGLLAEPLQAPYIVAFGALLALPVTHRLAGLPSIRGVATWIERTPTQQSRTVARTLARPGNGTVLVLALAGAGLHLAGFALAALIAETTAAILLVVTTHAAASRSVTRPPGFDEAITRTESEQSRLELVSIAPVLVILATGVLTIAALFALATVDEGLLGLAEQARPAIGLGVAIVAGANLARARLPRFEEHGPTRQAIAMTTLLVLVISLSFSVMLQLGVMTGPLADGGAGPAFSYAVAFSASVFALAWGLYPLVGVGGDGQPGEDEEPAEDAMQELEQSLVLVYAASGLFLLGAIGLLALVALGEIDAALPTSTEGLNAAFLALLAVGLMLFLGLAVLFFRSRQIEAPLEQEEEFERSYTTQEVVRLMVLTLSGLVAAMLAAVGTLVFMGQMDALGPLALEPRHGTDFWVFAVLIGLGPAGYLHNRERRRIKAIDERLPEFLRDLAESQRTGMTLTQAVITSSKGHYGALTPEIRRMAAQIEWGVSFEHALSSFAERVDTPLAHRTTTLVIEASTSGGDVMDVLEAAADDAREIRMIEQERKSGMQIYVMIIYIAFFVFLGVIGVLNVKFMPEVAAAVSGASGVSIGSIQFQEFDIQTFQTLFFHGAIIQALGGFVAGSMEDGTPVAGLKHAFAMTGIAYIAFRFLLAA